MMVQPLQLLRSLVRKIKTYRNKNKKPASGTEHRKRYPHAQNRQQYAISARIDYIAYQLDGYIKQQERTESRRRFREILTIVGLFGAAFFAFMQWQIFRQQAADFRDQERRQLRAYVFGTVEPNLTDAAFFTTEDKLDRLKIRVNWSNKGITPTSGLMVRENCTTIPNITTAFKDSFDNPEAPPQYAVLGPAFSVKTCEMTQSDVRAWVGTNNIAPKLTIWGWATYKDSVALQDHETRFCIKVIRFTGDWDKKSLALETVFCDAHNCTDDECKSDK